MAKCSECGKTYHNDGTRIYARLLGGSNENICL